MRYEKRNGILTCRSGEVGGYIYIYIYIYLCEDSGSKERAQIPSAACLHAFQRVAMFRHFAICRRRKNERRLVHESVLRVMQECVDGVLLLTARIAEAELHHIMKSIAWARSQIVHPDIAHSLECPQPHGDARVERLGLC